MSATPKKRTSEWLDQFKQISGCTFDQSVVDGLRAEIAALKEENDKLKAETAKQRAAWVYQSQERGRLEAKLLEAKLQQTPCKCGK